MNGSQDRPRITEAKPDLELLQRKRELAILNAIFEIVSNTNNLNETLERSLDFVLSYIDSAVGWVCLLEQDGDCSAFVGYKGLCFKGDEGSPTPCLARCVCDRVRRTKDVVVVNELHHGCPLLLLEGDQERLVVGHISVPLTYKSRIVGQLNVAFNNPGQIDPMDIELLRTIGPQLAVAIENARLLEALQHKEKMRTELLKKVVSAQEEERRRISRELHDEMGQNLTSMMIGLRVLQKTDKCEEADRVIGTINETIMGMISSIHDLALELRPPALDDLGLAPALEQYIKECPVRLGIEADFEAVGLDGRRFSREIETTLYRIVQESLTNVARHSQARKANVVLKAGGRSIVLVIEDDGVGFDLKAVQQRNEQAPRLGLYGMEERASLAGGKLTVESAPGTGTTIHVEIPLETA